MHLHRYRGIGSVLFCRGSGSLLADLWGFEVNIEVDGSDIGLWEWLCNLRFQPSGFVLANCVGSLVVFPPAAPRRPCPLPPLVVQVGGFPDPAGVAHAHIAVIVQPRDLYLK